MNELPRIPWSLEDWLRYSIFLIEAEHLTTSLHPSPPMTKVQLFLHLRYTRMGALFPHEPFSVNEATPAFFRETLDYVTGIVPMPERRPGVKVEDAKHDLYWVRYRDWVRKHQEPVSRSDTVRSADRTP